MITIRSDGEVRSDSYYAALERPKMKQAADDLEAQKAEFLARGGKIQQIEPGVTSYREKSLKEIGKSVMSRTKA